MTLEQIIKDIEKDLFNKIYNRIEELVKELEIDIRKEVGISLRKAPHYDSLSSGKLAEDFGFPAGRGFEFADAVIDAVENSVLITVSKTSGNITVDIVVSREDLSDVLSAKLRPHPSKSGQIDWLTWLLLRGNDVIIKNWGVLKKGIRESSSRSGKAIMAPVPNPLAISFSVRKDFSGTRGNNWITQSIRMSEPRLNAIIDKFIKKTLKI